MKKLTLLNIIFLLSSALTGPLVYALDIGDFNFRFNHRTIIARLLATKYDSAYIPAAQDYLANTPFDFGLGPPDLLPPYSGHVAFIEGDYGILENFSSGTAFGVAYNYLAQECVKSTGGATGFCTKLGADFGVVKFNTVGDNVSKSLQQRFVSHELAHILGLGHDFTCGQKSLMAPYQNCSDRDPLLTTLQPYDSYVINLWYPSISSKKRR